MLPSGDGTKVGLGGGRFATLLGIESGIDPFIEMMKIAKKRRIKVKICEIAEGFLQFTVQFRFHGYHHMFHQ